MLPNLRKRGLRSLGHACTVYLICRSLAHVLCYLVIRACMIDKYWEWWALMVPSSSAINNAILAFYIRADIDMASTFQMLFYLDKRCDLWNKEVPSTIAIPSLCLLYAHVLHLKYSECWSLSICGWNTLIVDLRDAFYKARFCTINSMNHMCKLICSNTKLLLTQGTANVWPW